MTTFIVNFILFVVSAFFAHRFAKAVMGEAEMGYEAPFWPKFGFTALIWVSQWMIAAIIIMLTDPLIRPFWYNFPFSWMGVTAVFSFLCLLSTLIPEQKEEGEKNRVVGITAPAPCPSSEERLFWNKDLGLFILETVQAMGDDAVRKLYYDSKKQMYSLDKEGKNWSYMLHINSIAFVVATDRGLNLTV